MTANDGVATWSATKLEAAIRARELTSRDLLELYADRIERLNPPINAVVTLDLDAAPIRSGPGRRRGRAR